MLLLPCDAEVCRDTGSLSNSTGERYVSVLLSLTVAGDSRASPEETDVDVGNDVYSESRTPIELFGMPSAQFGRARR